MSSGGAIGRSRTTATVVPWKNKTSLQRTNRWKVSRITMKNRVKIRLIVERQIAPSEEHQRQPNQSRMRDARTMKVKMSWKTIKRIWFYTRA